MHFCPIQHLAKAQQDNKTMDEAGSVDPDRGETTWPRGFNFT